MTLPELEVAAPAIGSTPQPSGPPADGFAPADLEISANEAPTDEHLVFEPAPQHASDLAADPVDDALELLGDEDLAVLATEIDLVDGDATPTQDEASPHGLFDAPGTDLSTLPDPDARKKS